MASTSPTSTSGTSRLAAERVSSSRTPGRRRRPESAALARRTDRLDVVPRAVQRGTNQIRHPGVHDHEPSSARALLQVDDRRQQRAARPDNPAARLEQQHETGPSHRREHGLGVFGRRYHGLSGLVLDAETSAEIEVLDARHLAPRDRARGRRRLRRRASAARSVRSAIRRARAVRRAAGAGG